MNNLKQYCTHPTCDCGIDKYEKALDGCKRANIQALTDQVQELQDEIAELNKEVQYWQGRHHNANEQWKESQKELMKLRFS